MREEEEEVEAERSSKFGYKTNIYSVSLYLKSSKKNQVFYGSIIKIVANK